MRRSSPFASADSTYCTKFSGTHTTLRMPRATVPMCTSAKPAVEQVGHDLGLAGPEHLFRNLAADGKRAVGQRLLVAAAGELELEAVLRSGEHDERALGARNVDRRVEHERQHFLQDATGAEGPEPFEQRGDLPQVVARRRRRRGSRLRGRVGGQEHEVGAAAPAEPNAVAGPERAFRVTCSPLTNVPYRESRSRSMMLLSVGDDFRVLARDFAARRAADRWSRAGRS